MCLAVPARVISIDDQLASVEVQGVRRAASLMLLPEAAVGDYVLVHAGFAMQIVDEEEVRAMEALRAEMQGAPRTVDTLRTH
jgi:hydrogenase assembly chaperone hypC/hupF